MNAAATRYRVRLPSGYRLETTDADVAEQAATRGLRVTATSGVDR